MTLFNASEKNPWAYLLEPSLGKIPNQENKRDYFTVSIPDSLNQTTTAVFKELEQALEIINILKAHSYEQIKLTRKNVHRDQIFFQDNQMFIQMNENETLPIWSEVNSVATDEILKIYGININPYSNSIENEEINSENEFFLSHRSKFDILSQKIKNKLNCLFCCAQRIS